MSGGVANAEASVAIVGAGPQGLATALHLLDRNPGLHRDLVVLDPSGGWLRAWADRFARLQIEHLRSPGVHHPGCDPYQLGAWSHAEGVASDLPYALPSSEVFCRFCAHLVTEAELTEHVVPTRVRDIDPGRHTTRLVLADGTALMAGHVVIAVDPAYRRLPHWVTDTLAAPADALAHADDVDLRGLDLRGQHVAIVGGGLSAGHLAVGAVAQGATVTLICRRPMREQMFDTDPGWLGPKHLDRYDRLADPTCRVRRGLAARDGGSMPPWITSRLGELREAGALRLLAPQRICGVHRVRDRIRLVLGDETRLDTDRVWLATGTQPHVHADRITATLQVTHPTRVVDGWPLLDRHLVWPGTNVHLVGRLAMLTLGPAAGNLWGARAGATRVAELIHGQGREPRVGRRRVARHGGR